MPRGFVSSGVHSGSLVALLALAVLAIPGVALGAKPGPSLCEPVVPCADSRGCPDLLVDAGVLGELTRLSVETHHYSADTCVVVEGIVEPGVRTLLTFSTMTVNFGAGDLFLGDPLEHPEWFDLETCHRHIHIKEYADYRLWTEAGYEQWTALRAAAPGACAQEVFAAHPELEAHLVRGAKRGFCFFDVLLAGDWPGATLFCPGTPDPRKYTFCGFAGLSVCWADIYEPFIDGQWIDITGLPDGTYVLENEANARHFFAESNFTNNSAAVRINLSRRSVTVLR